MQALISNSQELRFIRNENTTVHNRFSYSFDISRPVVDLWQNQTGGGGGGSAMYFLLFFD